MKLFRDNWHSIEVGQTMANVNLVAVVANLVVATLVLTGVLPPAFGKAYLIGLLVVWPTALLAILVRAWRQTNRK